MPIFARAHSCVSREAIPTLSPAAFAERTPLASPQELRLRVSAVASKQNNSSDLPLFTWSKFGISNWRRAP
eukprot:scaffold9933_cov125-Isochrysis_galbana.AAC.2